MNKISYSGVSEYEECSEKFNLNRIQKLRPEKVQSSLLWGGAIDEGLNELLRTKLEPQPEIFPTPYKSFRQKWDSGLINDVLVDYKFSTLIEYSKKDLDLELFTDVEWNQIKEVYEDQEPKAFAQMLQAEREKLHWSSYSSMPEETKQAYNFICWLSLARKAEYIFEAYKNEILPLFKRVLTIQEPIELENEQGDKVTGIIDFIVELQDGRIVVMDNKTTSKFSYYPDDVLKYQPENPDAEPPPGQLFVYAFAKDLQFAGYVAMLKEIKGNKKTKAAPSVKFKFIIEPVNSDYQTVIINKFNLVNTKIKNKEFKKLDDEKKCFFYGKKCPYYDKCWNNSMKGLVQKAVKDE